MVVLAALVIVLMKLFPDMPFSRWLAHWLVEKPLEWLASAQRHHIIFVVLVIALLLSPEAQMMLGALDLSAVSFALDMSLYIDAIAAMALAGVASNAVRVWHSVRLVGTRRRRRAMRGRRRRRIVRPRQDPANDEEGSSSNRISGDTTQPVWAAGLPDRNGLQVRYNVRGINVPGITICPPIKAVNYSARRPRLCG